MKRVRRCFFFLMMSGVSAGQTPGPLTSPEPPPARTIAPLLSGTTGVYYGENFRNLLASRNPDYPALQPWIFNNLVTHRFNYNDYMSGAVIMMQYRHGGSNFMGVDTRLNPKRVYGNFENASALMLDLNITTDVQDGGTLDVKTNHYGHGDSVMFTATTNGTGGSRGADEHNRVFRVFSQFHGNNYGIRIATLTTDAFGQAILTAPTDAEHIPVASPGHDLNASMENGPLLNTNPAKVYTAGNVAGIEICPAGTPNAEFYICVTGDAATRWSARYGLSRMTTLTEDISDVGPATKGGTQDAFAAGAVCRDVPVGNSSIFKVGQLFTISSAGDNFEQPAVLAVGTKTIRACFAKPHAAGELLTSGGAVGHAFSFTNDDMAPHTVPGVDNKNESTLRLGYPIVGSLAGNVLMVWVDPATSGTELKTKGFDANMPVLPALFTPVLGPATHGIISWTIQSNGDYHTKSTMHEGADFLPPPGISFAGSMCTAMPVAHTVYTVIRSSQVSVKPVTDKPGNCSSVKMKLEREYPNPASIYPMLWARSNRDPNFKDSTSSQSIGMSASTDGYMVAGGGSTEFAVGDPVELGYWWQQYMSSDITMSKWVGKSHRYGSTFNLNFNGVEGEAMMNLVNFTNPADYYGTPESGYVPGLHGEGRMPPPKGYQITGPIQYGLVMPIPTPRAGSSQDVGGLRFYCGSGPCNHNVWNKYDWINAEGKNDQAGLRYDPEAHSLTFYNYRGGLFIVPDGIKTGMLLAKEPGTIISIDDTAVRDGKGALRSGTLQPTGVPNLPCDADHRFVQNPVAGGPGVADSYRVCLKDAHDQYAWHILGIVD